MYKGTSIWLLADFSEETLQARREPHDILKVMKGENLQSRTFYLARLSSRFDGDQKFYKQAKAKNSAPPNHFTGSVKKKKKNFFKTTTTTTRNMKMTKGKSSSIKANKQKNIK